MRFRQQKLSLAITGGIVGAVLLLAVGVGQAQKFENTLETQIVAKEREGLDALKAGDIDRFGKLTARDAVFVDDHGAATRAEVLQHVGEFHLESYAMTDVKFVPISGRAGLIVYTITEKGASHGHKFSAKAYVSSVWEQRGSDWLCVFSQESSAK